MQATFPANKDPVSSTIDNSRPDSCPHEPVSPPFIPSLLNKIFHRMLTKINDCCVDELLLISMVSS